MDHIYFFIIVISIPVILLVHLQLDSSFSQKVTQDKCLDNSSNWFEFTD